MRVLLAMLMHGQNGFMLFVLCMLRLALYLYLR